MSYEQPKYINESQADLFQNLQNTINESVLTSKKTIADQNYRNELYNNETILEGQNASANVISDVNKNQSGSQITVGKTDQFFNSYTEIRGKCQADHIWPHSLGGPSIKENRLFLCSYHNCSKSNSIFNKFWLSYPIWLNQYLEKILNQKR